MKISKKAASCLRETWQGHDEKDVIMCSEGASGLYRILTNVSNHKVKTAGTFVREAFWLADKAEKYQNSNEQKETQFYYDAGDCLVRSRCLVGLELESVAYTIKWWKSYRHKDKEAVYENLTKEQWHQFRAKDVKKAEKCAGILMEAAEEHKKRNWEAVDNVLVNYFEIYLRQFTLRNLDI